MPRKPRLPQGLKDRVRKLRGRSTDAEKTMWHLLRNRGFHDVKFRRQHPIGPFILDFYCEETRLAIELDGNPHNEVQAILSDRTRTTLLREQHGMLILRFWNNEVLRDAESVLRRLWTVLALRLASPPAVTGAKGPSIGPVRKNPSGQRK